MSRRAAGNHRKPVAALLAGMCTILIAACSTATHQEHPASSTSAGFPIAVDNCGANVTLNQPPTRVVGYYQQSVELMLTLGLQKSVVGTVYPDNPPLPQYEASYTAIPRISNRDASFEQILAYTPDFVYGGYRSAFDDAAGRSRKSFAEAGITTYLNPEYCATKPITMDDVYSEVHRIAKFFAVNDRADKVVTDMQSSLAEAAQHLTGVKPLNVFVYDSGDTTATTAGGKGIGNQVITLAGGHNIFADLTSTFSDVSWEQIVQRSPDVIVIYDYFGTPSVDSKQAYLRSRPELAGSPAIRNNRFAVLNLQDAVLGVRAPYAVTTLAKQLHPERFS